MANSEEKVHRINELITQSREIGNGIPARYRLNPSNDAHEKHGPFSQKTFGERDNNKPHKTILMVGETGTGKTTLINTMINYMLGVERKDKVWFEITDEQAKSDEELVHSQTTSINIYNLYLEESKTDLTIIDTPGYGDTHGVEKDKEIAESLLSLSRCDNFVHEIHIVCLVINATQNRLSERQIYIFDAVQSLFGRDIAENIVLLFTHSTGRHPRNALAAVNVAKVKCAVNVKKNQPVYFLFDNCHTEPEADENEEQDERSLDKSWDFNNRGIKEFFNFLDCMAPKNLIMTQNVLQERNQLESKVSNFRSSVEMTEKKQNELKQTQKALEENKEHVKQNENFEYEVEVSYKEKVDIDPKKWRLTKKALCCTVCMENCHYPGCWWAKNLSWCQMMKDNHCTVCTKKCHYSKHIKEAKIYEIKTKKEKSTYEDLKKKYEDKHSKETCLLSKLEEELQNLDKEKSNLLNEAFHCVETLEKIALNTDSLLTLQYTDFLIEKLKEINEPEKADALEKIKMRAGEGKNRALEYIKKKILK